MKDRRSEILVIPAIWQSWEASVQQAKRFVELIIANDDESAITHPRRRPTSNTSIPWHISNRYYEADVHFQIAQQSLSERIQGQGIERLGRRRYTARQVHLRTDGPNAQTDDGKNDDQIRDIFAALELGKPPKGQTMVDKGRSQPQEELETEFREQVAGVQAILILVNREQGLSEHRRMLEAMNGRVTDKDSSGALLSGFDLAISLAAALPAPLRPDTGPSSLSLVAHSEEVEEMYAEHGWEYVDLAKVESYIEEDAASNDQISVEGGKEEKQGIERIREALMTHTWPALKRKQDRSVQRITGQEGRKNSFRDFQLLDLETLDEAGLAHPTEKDEELARAFLAQIEASGLAQVNNDDNSDKHSLPGRQRTHADMQLALERFLEDEDSQWPAVMPTRTKESLADDEAWPSTNAERPNDAADDTFDDDFSEFVDARSSDAAYTDPVLLPASLVSKNDTFDDEEGLHFIGDSDDAMLMRALEERRGGKDAEDPSDILQLNFEHTLQAVLAHAERVRALPDHEQRREEAARVALALLDR